MGAKLNSADINRKMDDGEDDKLHDSETTDLKSSVKADSVTEGTVCPLRKLHCSCLWIYNFVKLIYEYDFYIFPVSCLQDIWQKLLVFQSRCSLRTLNYLQLTPLWIQTKQQVLYLQYINSDGIRGGSIQSFSLKVARCITRRSSLFKILKDLVYLIISSKSSLYAEWPQSVWYDIMLLGFRIIQS